MVPRDIMKDKLTDDYNITQVLGNGGFAVGYYAPKAAKVNPRYDFPKGTYSLMMPFVDDEQGSYYLWSYDPKE